jgi:CubicO group peptidase (beta-lactamase class C family)
VEAFFEGLMLSYLKPNHIPGAAVVIVESAPLGNGVPFGNGAPFPKGGILFSKGYGYADVETRAPVDPATTLFRIGSVSKLFTWTAVMQLAEQGQVDLDADINTYLDFEIPATYPAPITLKHLLSHTAGFEDRSYDMWAASPDARVPLGDWLKTHIPARVRPPGMLAAYSNYGTTLAGYIVARVSGMAYADYVAHTILQPLEMAHSSAHQPLPSDLSADVASGYQFAGGQYVAQDFEILNIVPAGALSATPNDMAHFMLAHLQGGQYNGNRILETPTAQQMHTCLFSHDARIPGLAYGFFEKEQGGQSILWHGGDTLFSHSQLALLPEAGVGFFFVCNSATCTGLPQAVFNAFMAHYYPSPTTTPPPAADFEPHAHLVTGSYRSTRRSYTTAEGVMSLLKSAKVRAQDDHTVLYSNTPFVEIAPFVFQEVDGEHQLAFHQDAEGTVTHAALDGAPEALERVPAMDRPVLHLTLLGLSMTLFLSALLGGPVVFFARLGCGCSHPPKRAQVARWVLAGASLACLVFLVLAGWGAATGEQGTLTGQVSFWRRVYAWNQTLPEAERVRVVGLDVQHQYPVGVWHMGMLLPDTPPDAFAEPVAALRAIVADDEGRVHRQCVRG